MAWAIEWDDDAVRGMRSVGHSTQQRIARYLKARIAGEDDPRRFGKALTGDHAGLWRYRVGDYRLVCRIEDDRLTVLVITVGHRRLVYQ